MVRELTTCGERNLTSLSDPGMVHPLKDVFMTIGTVTNADFDSNHLQNFRYSLKRETR
jgi:hypothetical protein